MTTQERLREAAKYMRTQYPRPCSDGMFVDELMVQAAEEIDEWIILLADTALESATAQGLRSSD
jgi:hypothetical protein